MATITGKKAIFFVTSPRTPDKMHEEIPVLINAVGGHPWNNETQASFYTALVGQDFFYGSATGDIAFKARDRMNRSPKSLGLVDLQPVVRLTAAGKEYLYGQHSQDIFTKQLLKFQLPSPFHEDTGNDFNVRPYLELIRMIKLAEGLSKLEIAMFVMQITNYQKFASVLDAVLDFRQAAKNRNRGVQSYANFVNDYFDAILVEQFSDEIASGNIGTRESEIKTVANFLSKKKGNHRDYADAAIRYLRATGLFNFDIQKNRIYVNPERSAEVTYICEHADRVARAYASLEDFKHYLYGVDSLQLLTDQPTYLIDKIGLLSNNRADLAVIPVTALKNMFYSLKNSQVQQVKQHASEKLKNNYSNYDEIIDVFNKITQKQIVDSPLFMEWNTWRALTMLNDGQIQGNFRIDEVGLPLYAAAGNQPDIECAYDDFTLVVEVTLSSGAKQYEMEGEPVARHVGAVKQRNKNETYCLFIAPKISEATIAQYYILHRLAIAHYGGKSKIIPISLDEFITMITNAKLAVDKPKSVDIKQFCVLASQAALEADNERQWSSKIADLVTQFS